MTNPNLSQIHVNQPLSNFSLAYAQESESFVADKVFPVVPVEFKSNTYYQYDRGSFNRIAVKERAAGTESAGAGYNISVAAAYLARVYAVHHDIADQERANADSQINLDFSTTQFLTNQMLLNKENLWANAFMKTGVWSNETTPSTLWSATSSSPIEDIRNMKRTVQLTAGSYRPNTLVCSRPVFDKLIDNSEIVTRVTYSVKSQGDAALVTKDTLAQVLEIDRVLVMDGIYNSAVEGATESNSFFGGKSALLVYVPKGVPTLNSVAAGLTFAWTGQFGSTSAGTRMLSVPMPWLASTRLEAEAAFTHAMIAPDLGAYFLNCIA